MECGSNFNETDVSLDVRKKIHETAVFWEKKSHQISSNPNVIKPVQVVEDKDDSPLPTSSFNLTLSEKEKEDRSKVELPYLRKKEAKIEYIPDENDDWDDEDPDDDLEFWCQ